ncbi:MAG: hypothetical protein NC338_03905 [Firmicutes bacterium]|nr:hypothetical protein [Bacillota bacterium]MCM1400890.1 hypothetical protein [Bacteroides sp.]MCM1476276.1 hypothetical protein [Bacteroides sp.]
MLKTSTQQPSAPSGTATSTSGPRKSTIDFLRQFARAYTAPCAGTAPLPGVVLN